MMKNYKFNRNPEQLSRQDIEKHMDFDALLQEYDRQKAPRRPALVRRLAWIGSAAAAALMGWWLFFGSSVQPTYETRNRAYFAEQPFVNPPCESQAKAQFARYTFPANQGAIYEYASGSRLIVPPSAFETNAGATVDGDVDIYYREMHDFVDFFMSGIPMTYDSAGVTYTLESAGMIEIYAEQDGQRIRMRPGKTIEVELVSEITSPNINVPPRYNIYKLDTAERRWIYQDVDQIQIVDTEMDALDTNHPLYEKQKNTRQKLETLEIQETNAIEQLSALYPAPAEPLRPERPDGSNFVFDFDLSQLSGAPTQYEGTLWQVRPGQGIGEAELNREWDDMQLLPLNSRDFELNLINDEEILTVIVSPVLTGSRYEQALARYNQEIEAYRQEMNIWEQIMGDLRDSVQLEFRYRREELEQHLFEQITEWQEQSTPNGEQPMARHKIINRFQANSLGIWNCDRPLPPEMVQVQARFEDAEGNLFTQCTGYLVDKHKNVLQFLVDEDTQLRFNKNADNLLWIVAPDGRIGIFRPQEFKELNTNRRRETLELTMLEEPIESEGQIREILYF